MKHVVIRILEPAPIPGGMSDEVTRVLTHPNGAAIIYPTQEMAEKVAVAMNRHNAVGRNSCHCTNVRFVGGWIP